MDCLQFISVLDMLSGSGTHSLNIILTSYNAVPNIAITAVATGNSSLTQVQLAKNIEAALIAELTDEDALFQGEPVFSGTTPPALFKVTRTDHVVAIWSQAQFEIEVTLNPVANTVLHSHDLNWGSTPCLMTMDDLETLAALYAIDLEDSNGNDLTNLQKAILILRASARLISILRNNIVISTYLHEEIGRMTNNIKLLKHPVVSYDSPKVRTPGMFTLLGVIRTISSFNVTSKGWVNFQQANTLIDVNPPFDWNNQIRMTYQAGQWHIPEIIKDKLMVLMVNLLEAGDSGSGIKVLQAGTGKVEYFTEDTFMVNLLFELSEYSL